MLKVISNNDKSALIEKFSCAQVALNAEEAQRLLLDTPKEQFLMSTAGYQMSREQMIDIDPDVLPSLKKFMKGPFLMQVSNRGASTERSLLCFDIAPIERQERYLDGSDAILKDGVDLAVRSLAALPFVDVFREKIEQEAQQAERLISKSQNRFRHAAEKKDRQTVDLLTEAFLAHVRDQDKGPQQGKENLIGLEAISDSLAPSLNASSDFYKQFWDSVYAVYAPVIRQLGEDYALGKVKLDANDLRIT